MAPAWWAAQLEGQPEITILGKAPSGIPASRTAFITVWRTPWLSRTPCWQVAAPMQATLHSNSVAALSSVTASTFSASAEGMLMI